MLTYSALSKTRRSWTKVPFASATKKDKSDIKELVAQLRSTIAQQTEVQILLLDQVQIVGEEHRRQYAIGLFSVFQTEEELLPMLCYAITQEIQSTGTLSWIFVSWRGGDD